MNSELGKLKVDDDVAPWMGRPLEQLNFLDHLPHVSLNLILLKLAILGLDTIPRPNLLVLLLNGLPGLASMVELHLQVIAVVNGRLRLLLLDRRYDLLGLRHVEADLRHSNVGVADRLISHLNSRLLDSLRADGHSALVLRHPTVLSSSFHYCMIQIID